jgi:hypothetical protein
MKNFFFSLLILIVTTNALNAQTEKGDWLVGGSLTLNTTSDNSQFTFIPSVGHFFATDFAVGAEFIFTTSKLGNTKRNGIGIGPFARYYFTLNESAFKPLAQAGFSIQSVNTTIKTGFGETKTSDTQTSVFIGGGGAYFINSNVALEAVLGYNHTKIENQPSNGGFLMRIGLQVHLNSGEVSNVKKR